MFCHQFIHHLDRAFEVEAFSRPHIQLEGNGIQLFLAGQRQIRSLGEILANQAIDILVAASLPRAMGITEVDGDASILRDSGMPGHLPSLVIRQSFSCCQWHSVQRGTEALYG